MALQSSRYQPGGPCEWRPRSHRQSDQSINLTILQVKLDAYLRISRQVFGHRVSQAMHAENDVSGDPELSDGHSLERSDSLVGIIAVYERTVHPQSAN